LPLCRARRERQRGGKQNEKDKRAHIAMPQAPAAPFVPFGTTMKTSTRAGVFGSADPNVECNAPVGSKNVSPVAMICAGP
jgi:hypothetical protein